MLKSKQCILSLSKLNSMSIVHVFQLQQLSFQSCCLFFCRHCSYIQLVLKHLFCNINKIHKGVSGFLINILYIVWKYFIYFIAIILYSIKDTYLAYDNLVVLNTNTLFIIFEHMYDSSVWDSIYPGQKLLPENTNTK